MVAKVDIKKYIIRDIYFLEKDCEDIIRIIREDHKGLDRHITECDMI